MKTIYALAMFLFCTTLWSQTSQKNDIIVFSNGELLQAQVTRVTDNTISYQYPGETVQNEIDQSNLEKIIFASGRTQAFGSSIPDSRPQPAVASQTSIPLSTSRKDTQDTNATRINSSPSNGLTTDDVYLLPDYEENSVAVLPINFTKNNVYDSDLAGKATEFVASYLAQQSGSSDLKVQNVNTTITNLIKSRIGPDEVQTVSQKELLKIVNTEFAVKINIIETQKDTKAPQSKEVVSGYFNQQPQEKNVDDSDLVEGASKISIVLEVYGANDQQPIYSSSISEKRISNQNGNTSQSQPYWRSILSYALSGYLNI